MVSFSFLLFFAEFIRQKERESGGWTSIWPQRKKKVDEKKEKEKQKK